MKYKHTLVLNNIKLICQTLHKKFLYLSQLEYCIVAFNKSAFWDSNNTPHERLLLGKPHVHKFSVNTTFQKFSLLTTKGATQRIFQKRTSTLLYLN